jgi:hypothetical protein
VLRESTDGGRSFGPSQVGPSFTGEPMPQWDEQVATNASVSTIRSAPDDETLTARERNEKDR